MMIVSIPPKTGLDTPKKKYGNITKSSQKAA